MRRENNIEPAALSSDFIVGQNLNHANVAHDHVEKGTRNAFQIDSKRLHCADASKIVVSTRSRVQNVTDAAVFVLGKCTLPRIHQTQLGHGAKSNWNVSRLV